MGWVWGCSLPAQKKQCTGHCWYFFFPHNAMNTPCDGMLRGRVITMPTSRRRESPLPRTQGRGVSANAWEVHREKREASRPPPRPPHRTECTPRRRARPRRARATRTPIAHRAPARTPPSAQRNGAALQPTRKRRRGGRRRGAHPLTHPPTRRGTAYCPNSRRGGLHGAQGGRGHKWATHVI